MSNQSRPGPPLPLRILFVSSTTAGGSFRSLRELNRSLVAAGVETMTLADSGDGKTVSRYLFEQLCDVSVRFDEVPVVGTSASWLRSLPGRHAVLGDDALLTMAPENAFPDIAIDFKPQIVIGSSILRPTWREIRSTCRQLGIASALYLREPSALRHLEPGQGSHDLVIANSKTLVAGAAEHGVTAAFVPSVVDLTAAATTTSRERVLLVNPRHNHGVDIAGELANSFPMINFVLQESWPLTVEERGVVDALTSLHPNIEFRPQAPEPSTVFEDAAVLLTPHRFDNRPRVILEAMSNGIPVISADLPGLVESVGPGGIVVDDRAGLAGWRAALERVWQNPAVYRQLQSEALSFSARPEVQTDKIVSDFIDHVQRAVAEHRGQRTS